MLGQGTSTSPHAAAYMLHLQRTLNWVYLRVFTFCVHFHSRLVAPTWKLIKFMLKTLVGGCQQHQIVFKKQTIDPAYLPIATPCLTRQCLSIQFIWTMRRSGNSAHPCRSPTPAVKFLISLRRHGHKRPSINTVAWWPVTGDCQHHCTPTALLKAFHKEPGCKLSRGRQTMCRCIWHIPKISQNFMGSEIVVCSATARTKSALGVILLISAFQGIILLIPGYHPPHWVSSSSFSQHLFSRHLTHAFPGRLTRERVPLVIALSPVGTFTICNIIRVIRYFQPITARNDVPDHWWSQSSHAHLATSYLYETTAAIWEGLLLCWLLVWRWIGACPVSPNFTHGAALKFCTSELF